MACARSGLAAVTLWLPISPSLAAQGSTTDSESIELGSRPFYLLEQMAPGPLKDELSRCAAATRHYERTDFSIGHRGAPMRFPEHTLESYVAAASMGAGIVECDVTFTKDRELVCRHDQCDLHATTNIVATELAGKCSQAPQFDAQGNLRNAQAIRCCTSDLTLKEFKSLEGKMDRVNLAATTIQAYLGDEAPRGTLLTHAQSIDLLSRLGVGMTPELKIPRVSMPFEGEYTQRDFAQQMIDEYVAAEVDPRRVWPQSFSYEDVLYWIEHTPAFGRQAVFLESRDTTEVDDPDAVAALVPSMQQLARDGVRYLAPPMQMMLAVDPSGRIVPSAYAKAARSNGLQLIGWTTERSGRLETGGGGYYYSTVKDVIHNDGDILRVIDVLAQDVGIVGLFSDWPATTTFYANCRPVKEGDGSMDSQTRPST
ncbi:MAG: glycerophosphodiester phosphodiesterase family protein [Halieaceae bacterium]|jgi:glycerophosphoryl diester phosphodiesterase|nr:glycerophosphodiester phosphodiesterase family protein [Halieaceae bacterium]